MKKRNIFLFHQKHNLFYRMFFLYSFGNKQPKPLLKAPHMPATGTETVTHALGDGKFL